MASYIFGGDTGETRESLERRREFARRMLEGSTSQMPNTVGEGIAALGMALSGRWGMNAANKEEASKREAASAEYAKNLPFWLQNSMGGASAPSAPSSSPSQPTRSSSPSMTPQQAPKGKEEFISMMMPAALQASERTGIDPRLIIAQAAQETGWGKSAPGNNYFGIKSHGQGGGQNLATHEYVDGKRVNVNANFRQYGSPTESALGYADFLLSNPRYQPMLNAEGLDAQLAALGQSGYATDPNYAQSVGSIARSIPLPPEMAGNQGQDAISAVTSAYAPADTKPTHQPGMVNDPAALGPARYAPGYAPQPPAPPAPQPPQPPFNPLMQRRDQLAQQTGSQQIAQADPSRGFLAAILGGGQGGQPSGGEFPPAPSPDGLDAMRGPQLPFDPAMLELANNPFLPEGQRAVLQSMIQQQMQAADPMRRLEMQRAQLELEQLRNPDPRDIINAGDGRLYNPNTGEWITAPGGSTEPPEIQKFYDENGMEVYRQWNPQTGEWDQVGGAKAPSGMNLSVDSEGNIRFTQGDIGAAGRNEGTLGKELSKADAALLTTARESATAAEDLNSLANQLDAVVNDVGYTGPGGGIYGAVDDAIRILPGDEAARGAFRSLAMEAQLTFTAKTKGAITDREMSMFRQAVPNLSQTPAGNEEIIKVIQAGADRVRKRADFYEQFLSQNGSLQGAQAAWGRFIDQNPIISEGADGSLMLNETQSFEPYLDPDYRGTAEKREPVRIDGYTIEEVD